MAFTENVTQATKICFALSTKECDLTLINTNESTRNNTSDLTIDESKLLGTVCFSIILISFVAYIPVLWVRYKNSCTVDFYFFSPGSENQYSCTD